VWATLEEKIELRTAGMGTGQHDRCFGHADLNMQTVKMTTME